MHTATTGLSAHARTGRAVRRDKHGARQLMEIYHAPEAKVAVLFASVSGPYRGAQMLRCHPGVDVCTAWHAMRNRPSILVGKAKRCPTNTRKNDVVACRRGQ
jgi:hypothetical protein